jgi:hypothetical protein
MPMFFRSVVCLVLGLSPVPTAVAQEKKWINIEDIPNVQARVGQRGSELGILLTKDFVAGKVAGIKNITITEGTNTFNISGFKLLRLNDKDQEFVIGGNASAAGFVKPPFSFVGLPLVPVVAAGTFEIGTSIKLEENGRPKVTGRVVGLNVQSPQPIVQLLKGHVEGVARKAAQEAIDKQASKITDDLITSLGKDEEFQAIAKALKVEYSPEGMWVVIQCGIEGAVPLFRRHLTSEAQKILK